MNKEFVLIAILIIILPTLIVLFGGTLASSLTIRWEASTLNNIGYICLLLAILGCVYIIIRNYALELHSLFWYVFPAVTGVILSLLLYTVYSLSHFGF